VAGGSHPLTFRQVKVGLDAGSDLAAESKPGLAKCKLDGALAAGKDYLADRSGSKQQPHAHIGGQAAKEAGVDVADWHIHDGSSRQKA
jgi:hypothetical protein